MADDDNLMQRALDAIRTGIVRGEHAFGARLSDRSLAAALGVSRTPVREALAQLAAEGLVVIRAQSGSFVMQPGTGAIRALCEMRAVLECGALRLAAGRDPEHLAAALSIPIAGATMALEQGDLVRVETLDEAFHEALVLASGNPLLVRAYRGIADQVSAVRHRLPRDRARMKRALAQHRRILDLTLTDQVAAAEVELAAHVRTVQGLAVDALRASDPKG